MAKQVAMKFTKLPVKLGRHYVYLEESESTLRLGSTGEGLDADVFVFRLTNKGDRRRIRQALDALGFRGLAKSTVPPQQISFARQIGLSSAGIYLGSRRDQENHFQQKKERIQRAKTELAYHQYAMGKN